MVDRNLDDWFNEENRRLLFDPKEYPSEYIAHFCTYFTEYLAEGVVDLDWCWSFPGSRYVIIVYQRHSVYEQGQCIYRNRNFTEKIGVHNRFRKPVYVVAVDTELYYSVSTWGSRKLKSNIVQGDKDTLNAKEFENIEDAIKLAKEYSTGGYRTAVLEWFEDYDHF